MFLLIDILGTPNQWLEQALYFWKTIELAALEFLGTLKKYLFCNYGY